MVIGLALDTLGKLRQRVVFLERALASARMGHFMVDPYRRIIELSPWVRANIGLNENPVALDAIANIVVEEGRDAFRQTVEDVLASSDDFAFEIQIVTPNDMIRTQRVHVIAAFEDEVNRTDLVGYFGILQEVTSQKEAERSLLEARDKARDELAARTNILATVSHEIRTPLGGILGIIDQLKREASPVERERALALIEDSCEVLLDTLDAILSQSRFDQRGDGLAIKVFSPRALANRVAELFRPVARRKALRIEVNATTEKEAQGDAARMQQMLANLVSNAVKFTQSGTITIFVQEPTHDSQEWTFVVSDTGAGMDKKRLEGLFEPFGESSDDTLGKTVGAGLGLSITRNLVEAMGGRIEVESELGKGTSFTIVMPLGEPPIEFVDPDLSATRGCVLLLIDRASDRVQAEAIAAQYGYDVCEQPIDAQSNPHCTKDQMVIVDAGLVETLDAELVETSEQVIVLGDGARPKLNMPEDKMVYVSQSNLARTLSEVFEARS